MNKAMRVYIDVTNKKVEKKTNERDTPNFNKETLDAISEAKRISKDPNAKSYSSMDKLTKALDD